MGDDRVNCQVSTVNLLLVSMTYNNDIQSFARQWGTQIKLNGLGNSKALGK